MQEEWDCEWTLVDDQVRADVESEYDDLVSGLRTRDPGFDLTSHSKPMPVHIRVNFRWKSTNYSMILLLLLYLSASAILEEESPGLWQNKAKLPRRSWMMKLLKIMCRPTEKSEMLRSLAVDYYRGTGRKEIFSAILFHR